MEKWKKVFINNETDENNENINRINTWFETINPTLKQEEIINHDLLIEGHPLMTPFTIEEINTELKYSKNKAPGSSGIGFLQLKHTPIYCRKSLNVIFDNILCFHYFPPILENINMIFLNKHLKDPSNPLNYRPICLLETVLRLFEKIIAQRLQYFLEYNNLLTEKQFGFRPNRSTQHPI